MSSPQLPDRWLFVWLCTLVAWAPLPLGSDLPWSWLLLLILVAALVSVLFIQLALKKLSLSPALQQSAAPLLLLLGLPLWCLIQMIPFREGAISLTPWATFLRLQQGLCYGFFFIACLQLLNSSSRLRSFAFVIIGSGLFQSCYGLLVTLGGSDFDIFHINSSYAKHDATGTFINRNHLAGYLELCLSVGIGLMIATMTHAKESGSWRAFFREFLRALLGDKARIRLFLVAMVIALVMTHSRMGNTAFFASMGIGASIGYFLYRKYSRSMVLLFASMIAIDVFIISSWFGLERLVNRLEQTDVAHEGRLDVVAQAWPWLQEHWLIGTGAGSFTEVFPFYRDSSVVGFYDFAHNDFLQLWGEYGVIGAALFSGFALLTLWTAIQAQRKRQNPYARGMAFAAMMGLISLAIHSSTDFNLHIPANAMLLTVVCALAFVSLHLEQNDAQQSRRRHRKTASVN